MPESAKEDEELKGLSGCAMQIVAQEKLQIKEVKTERDFDGNLVLCYQLEDPTSRELSRINNLLIDLIIERGMEATSGIAVFERA